MPTMKHRDKLTIFRRHTAACRLEYKSQFGVLPGRKLLTCGCPLHVEGYLGGDYIRKALNTSSAVDAVAMVQVQRNRGKWIDPIVRGVGAFSSQGPGPVPGPGSQGVS